MLLPSASRTHSRLASISVTSPSAHCCHLLSCPHHLTIYCLSCLAKMPCPKFHAEDTRIAHHCRFEPAQTTMSLMLASRIPHCQAGCFSPFVCLYPAPLSCKSRSHFLFLSTLPMAQALLLSWTKSTPSRNPVQTPTSPTRTAPKPSYSQVAIQRPPEPATKPGQRPATKENL